MLRFVGTAAKRESTGRRRAFAPESAEHALRGGGFGGGVGVAFHPEDPLNGYGKDRPSFAPIGHVCDHVQYAGLHSHINSHDDYREWLVYHVDIVGKHLNILSSVLPLLAFVGVEQGPNSNSGRDIPEMNEQRHDQPVGVPDSPTQVTWLWTCGSTSTRGTPTRRL